jgi:hypothetical protein
MTARLGVLGLIGVTGVTLAGLGCGLVGCSSPADDTSSGDSELSQKKSQFSYVGKAVKAALADQFPDEQGSSWDYSTDNKLEGAGLLPIPATQYWGQGNLPVGAECDPSSDASCDPDFKLFTCETQDDCGSGGTCTQLAATVAHHGDAPYSLCVGHSDYVLDEIYTEVIGAKQRVDVTSLTPPDGRYQAALRNAVTYLSENDSPPVIRMIFGQYPFEFVDRGDASSNMKAMTRDVAKDSSLQLSLSMYRDGLESWNHAKIIAVDGKEAIVGGMNMWTENYLQVDPVHDLSIHLHGSAAGDAERFADRLWSFACADESWLGETQVSTFPGNTSHCLPAFGGTEEHKAGSGIPVVAVGRLGKIGPEVADSALVALLDAAKTTIHIAQQDIGPPKEAGIALASWPEAYMESLVKAISRGVDVEFVVSNVGAVPGDLTGLAADEANYGNGWSPADVQQHILATAQAHPELWTSHEDVTTAMCAHLHVTTLAATNDATWPDGGKFALHTKLISVDSQAFYLGSQNMYVANLAEFGFIYDDAATTEKLENDYYAQMWGYSSPAATCSLQ